ncbi:GntR family transcriptional regulator [Paraglaciecola aquimarina]|uniref:GntR family transcriptional regulator n=1 Tax=Paraglaciecola aquimarina TaxID=1235557 RepID=A0ABU3SW24_9ALTE|nr:GntR family transcriptional regulator [Paraglaciecola aquimarina]MDU0354117.1 GntR family transcriptional regulator [Paraglaciecola aquimarina]
MKISVNIEHPIPLFTQLTEQIKQAVLASELVAGDALPSIRQLANDLDINHKTVAKAYRLLERDGVIQTKGYRGTFIHQNAKENSAIDLNEWVLAELDKVLVNFREAGVTESEMRIAFNRLMNSRKI